MTKKIILLISVLILFGCRTVTKIEYVDRYNTRTEYDSIYIDRLDSTYIYQKGDTVYQFKYKTFYRDRIKIKTDTLINKEYYTINKTKTVTRTVERKETIFERGFRKLGVITFIGLIIGMIYIILKNKSTLLNVFIKLFSLFK